MDISTSGVVPDPTCEVCGVVVTEAVNTETLKKTESEDDSKTTWSEAYSITNSTEKQVAVALEVVESLATRLNLNTKPREKAAEIYAEAAIENYTDGRSTKTLVAAAIYLAARECSNPRPAACIAEEADVDQRSLRRLIKILRQKTRYGDAIVSPEDYLPYLCEATGGGCTVETDARELLETVQSEVHFAGKSPSAIAAAALYLVSDNPSSQRNLASAAGVTTETIRVRLRELREAI